MTQVTQVQYHISQNKDLPHNPNNNKSINLRISQSNNMHIIHKALTQQMHVKRKGNANCKTRSHVNGSNKKPWRQKGTGRARAGSTQSPLWRGGGVIFGPKTKKYRKKINKKEKQLAISNLIYNKKNLTTLVDHQYLECNKPSTKLMLQKITKLNIPIHEKILIITSKQSIQAYFSIRNIKNIQLIQANQLNTFAILNAKYLIVDTKSLDIITQIYNDAS